MNEQETRFALSNVLYHKGILNDLLMIKWSKKYNVYYINKTYANCSYQFKGRNAKTNNDPRCKNVLKDFKGDNTKNYNYDTIDEIILEETQKAAYEE